MMICLMIARPLQAAQTGDYVAYDFTGTYVISTPCTINNDQIIDIQFGNVGIRNINGVNYMKDIPFTMDCHGAPDSSPLVLMVSGRAETFDKAAVDTTVNGLGIQIQVNGQPMTLNTGLRTTLGALSALKLTAVPVKDPVTALTEQGFSATATLTADYE